MDLTDDPLAGVDASELEADIDRAIDELFVKKGEAKEPSIAKPGEPAEKPVEEPKDEPAEEAVHEEPSELADDTLADLKESLLTLDWEITPESIKAFEKELQLVSDKVSDDRHCMAVIKMALGVLQYLRAAKESAAPISIQFLHGAIRGLDIFVREPAPTEAERNEVMDKLLGQFRRVKAEIQRMQPREAPEKAEEPPAVEPVVEPEPTEEPILEEITAEEPVLEDLAEEEAPAFEEIVEDETILEELPVETEIAAAPPEEEPLIEELVGEEPVVEELPPEELDFMADLEEEPTLAEPPEEEPTLEDITAEELTLEEVAPEEPTLAADLEEEPTLEDITAEELTLEEVAPEEPTLAADLEEEPILAEPPEEEVSLTLDLEEEPSFEELFDEEPISEEVAAEEPPLAPVIEEEPDIEEVFGEELGFEELPEEEPALEFMEEPEEVTPVAAVAVGEVPAALQNIVQEAKSQSGQLSEAVAALAQETEDFFGRIMKAMAGKPALAKLEQYFGSAHNSVEAKLSEARRLSENLLETLAQLEQNLGQQQVGTIAPDAQAAISSQVKTIRNAIENISQATSKLQQGLTGEARAPSADYQGIAFKDARAETEEFSFEPDDLMEGLDSEPVLDLVEEVTAEPLRPTPGTLATIYLADVANNTLGVPTEAVANVFKISKGKAKAIRKRGYVRLTDFKSAFRSIKRGITGPLAELKPKDLKKIQFPLVGLSPEILGSDDTEAVAPVRGIVLLSTGQRHGALLTDEVMQRTPYDVKGYQKAGLPGEVSGTATIEGDFEINVIDPDYVLS
ncbi:MAG: hypothetical protein LJE89_05370 [Deltaproteobacteria bacterium]|nr:hypothetical protein [Deltaproteobacteria bacterium]